MKDHQRRVQELLLVLADRSRFHMLCVLAERPVHVSELGRAVGLSQSCATRHVQALTSAGAVECRRDGKRVMVQVRTDDDVVRTLVSWMTGESGTAARIAAPPAARAAAVPSPAPPSPARAGGSPASRKSQTKERTPVPAPDSGTPAPAQAEQAPSMDSLPAARRALEDFLL